MKDDRIYELIFKLNSGEANDEERREIEDLIEKNPEIARLFAEEQRLDSLLHGDALKEINDNPDLTKNVMDKIDLSKYSQNSYNSEKRVISLKQFWLYFKYGLSFVGGAVAALLLFFVLNSSSNDLTSSSYGSLSDFSKYDKAQEVTSFKAKVNNGTLDCQVKRQNGTAMLFLETNFNKSVKIVVTLISQDLQALGVFSDNPTAECSASVSNSEVEITSISEKKYNIPLKASIEGSKFLTMKIIEDGVETFEKNFTILFK
jgi:hypothetical protein